MRRGRIATLAALVVVGVGVSTSVGSSSTMSTYIDAATNGPNNYAAAPDWTAPSASASVIAKAAGGEPGYVKSGGSYYVYANVTDTGNPAAGVASSTAGIANVSTTPTTAATTTGSWVIGGVTYTRRSAALTAKSSLTTGTLAYTMTSVDSASPTNSQSQAFSVVGDSTAPTATAITTANVAGGTVGKAQQGDTVSYTTSEPIDPDTVISGWDGTALDVIAAIYYDSTTAQDILVFGSAGNVQSQFGNVSLGRSDYITGNGPVYFGQTAGSRASIVRSGNVIQLTLGAASATVPTAASTGTLKWIPTTAATDRAGNAMSTTTISETGTADKDF